MTTQKPLMTRRTEASTRTVDLQSDVAALTALGYSFVSMINPLFFKSILPSNSSHVPAQYVRAASS